MRHMKDDQHFARQIKVAITKKKLYLQMSRCTSVRKLIWLDHTFTCRSHSLYLQATDL